MKNNESKYGLFLTNDLTNIVTRCQGIKLTVKEYEDICNLLDYFKTEILFPATMDDRNGK